MNAAEPCCGTRGQRAVVEQPAKVQRLRVRDDAARILLGREQAAHELVEANLLRACKLDDTIGWILLHERRQSSGYVVGRNG
jgi:hypothetical protein